MTYNPIPLLLRQFKTMASLEVRLSPEERKHHQWQLLANVGKCTLVISKGGANTIAYTEVNGKNKSDPEYMTPVQMLDRLEAMAKLQYVQYHLVQGKKSIKAVKDIRELLTLKPKQAASIVGITPTGKKELLQRWEIGVFDQKWKPAKTPARSAKRRKSQA